MKEVNLDWGPDDSAAASKEGWDVFDCGPRLEIERIDDPADTDPVFEDDDEAIEHVRASAAAGSDLHRRALAIHEDEAAAHPGERSASSFAERDWVTTGTSYFPTKATADDYYRPYGFDAAGVQRKIDEGEIHLGLPPVAEGERIVMVDEDLRYGIRSPR